MALLHAQVLGSCVKKNLTICRDRGLEEEVETGSGEVGGEG